MCIVRQVAALDPDGGVTYLLHLVGRHLLTLVDVADIAASADPYVPTL